MKTFIIENYTDFEEKFNNIEHKNIIINISATWCKPCNNIKEKLQEFIDEIDENNSIFLKIDYDKMNEEEEFNNYLEIKKIPYFYIFIEKKKVKEFQTSNIENIKINIMNELNINNNFNLTEDF